MKRGRNEEDKRRGKKLASVRRINHSAGTSSIRLKMHHESSK